MLTITVIVFAVAALISITYGQIVANQNSYNREISVSFSKSPGVYDFTCKSSDYQIYFLVKNLGAKTVADLSISITNPLCEGSIPSLSRILNASSSVSFEAQTTAENGTLTISGNNTSIEIGF